MSSTASLASFPVCAGAGNTRSLVCTGLCWSDRAALSMSRWSHDRRTFIQRGQVMQDFVKQTLRIQPSLLLIEVENSHDERVAFISQLLEDRGCPRISIMACSNSTQEDVIVQAFAGGAERFVHTGVSAREFAALAYALVRRHRSGGLSHGILSYGPFSLDAATHSLTHNDQKFRLTELEYQFLNILLQAQGSQVSTRTLLNRVWGISHHEPQNTNRVQTLASRVRHKAGLTGDGDWTLRHKAGYYSLVRSLPTAASANAHA